MIRVLCADLSAADEEIYRRLYDSASPQRKAKADRYRHRADALRCLAAEALLRRGLGYNMEQVETMPAGKPFLPEKPDVHFNLSHSGNWAVIAWGPSEVGVDVETPGRDTKIDAIARRYFHPEEQHFIFGKEDGRHQRFFEIWTGKESYVKYLGTGLKKDLTSFSVLSLEENVKLRWETLPDGSILSLCMTEDDYVLELLDVQCL